MKLYKENIFCASNAVLVKEEFFAFNDFPFHYHPEYELIFIIKGNGQRFIGDNMASFIDGQLYFLGSNLPHTFYNKHMTAGREIHQVVVQFDKSFVGNDFFKMPVFRRIKTFLEKSKRGFLFKESTVHLVRKKIMSLPNCDEAALIIELLSILNLLSTAGGFEYICSEGYNIEVNSKNAERIVAVYDYVYNHFKEDISLQQIASVACLSPEAFCRYFKKNTRKKFSEVLVEIRIGQACKLLQENKLSIKQISIDCGFNNMSYFNRMFKKITQQKPADYRNAFAEKSFDLVCAEMFDTIPN